MYYPGIGQDWADGVAAADYFPTLKYYRHLVQSLYRDVSVDSADASLVAAAIERACTDAAPDWRDRIRIVVMTEDWCGDSAVTVPYIARLAEAIGVPLRIFRQSEFSALKEWYVAAGTSHIPVVSIIDTATNTELLRWVERPAAAHGRVEEWIADHPEFPELARRKDTDEDASREFFTLYAKLLREMSGWYRGGLWPAIAEEMSAMIGSHAAS